MIECAVIGCDTFCKTFFSPIFAQGRLESANDTPSKTPHYFFKMMMVDDLDHKK
jgi:hypothetical protein